MRTLRWACCVAVLACGCDPYAPDSAVEYRFAVGAAVTIRVDGRPAIVMDQCEYSGSELNGETRNFYQVKYATPGSAIFRGRYVSRWLREIELEVRDDG